MNKRDKKIYLGTIVLLLLVWALMMVNMKADVSRVGESPQKLHEIFGWKIPLNGINVPTILNTWLIMAPMILAAYFRDEAFKKNPG